MNAKKVLIIAYYWPPSGGSGVQRWLKFVKYLPDFGIVPHVYVPANPNYPVLDESLQKDVPSSAVIIKRPIWEPYDIYRKFMGFSQDYAINHTLSVGSEKKGNWKTKLAFWLKSNLFIPDPRVFWLFNSLSFLQKYIEENQIETIITTGPPQSLHLIGWRLKKRMNHLQWIADFRDPWTTIFYFHTLPYTYFSKKLNQYLEKSVLQTADEVITVSQSIADELGAIAGKKVQLIHNGFDEDDFVKKEENASTNSFFDLLFLGTLPDEFDYENFLMAVDELYQENDLFKQYFKLKFAGKVHESIVEKINHLSFKNAVEYLGYLKHEAVPNLLAQTAVLLLLLPKKNYQGVMSGKTYEYMASLKPILAVVPPESEVAVMLKTTQAGTIANSKDKMEIKKQLGSLLDLFLQKKLHNNQREHVEDYSRKNLTKKLVALIR